MEDITWLIEKTVGELEKNNEEARLVGNRPHFPMLVMFDQQFKEEIQKNIFYKISKVWPQTVDNLMNVRYDVKGKNIFSFAFGGKESVEKEELIAALDDTKKARNSFESMERWCVYNIIDTAGFDTFEEFSIRYNAISAFQEMVVDAQQSMLILLLDDSTSKRTVAKEIREYLSENTIYDSTIIISNRTRNNVMYDMSEMYRIVASILLISNNDAVGEADDQDYRARVTNLYNKGTYTLSYMFKERPNRKIVLQLYDLLLGALGRYREESVEKELGYWKGLLEINTGQLAICEKFLGDIKLTLDVRCFEGMPIRACAVNEKIDFHKMTYAQFKEYTFSDVLDSFAENIFDRDFSAEIDVSRCIDEFSKFICEKSSIYEMSKMSKETIEALIKQLDIGSVSENMLVMEYLNKKILVHIRRDLIYPQLEKTLYRLSKQANEMVGMVERISKEYNRYVPVDGFTELGVLYKNYIENYMQTESGRLALQQILSLNNSTNEDIFEKMFAFFKGFVRHNKELFSLSFVREWEKRLGFSGDRIYKEISQTLTDDENSMIRLYGAYSISKELKICMLHTTDSNGTNLTELYRHLKQTFENSDEIQYFNTGSDEAMEVITFVSCSGMNLIL